ncbi:MAG: hypothetical protein LBU17_01415 [Treponema sp.]|nr:hypothetical protein [Treponema sp.]
MSLGIPPQSRDVLVSLFREACDESNLPFRVDLLEWASLPEDFQNNIP